MKLTERSYGGKIFRPRPRTFLSDDKNLLVIATPWGPRRMADVFLERIASEAQNPLSDPDLTILSTSNDIFNERENRLRLGLLSLHEDLREEFNAETLTSGLEILCLLRTHNKICWFQVGAPYLGLMRTPQHLPLYHPVDLSFDHSTPEKILPPLPRNLFGFSSHSSLEQGHFMQKPGDRLLLISRSYVPQSVFSLNTEDVSLDTVTQHLAQDHEEQPFWLGLIHL